MPSDACPQAARRNPTGVCLLAVLLTPMACSRYQPPPPHVAFGALPVSGSLADARFAGFRSCTTDATSMRCRRNVALVLQQGPFNAAVDLGGSDGHGGFDQLTLWDDRDQDHVLEVGKMLERQGWRACFTGDDTRGDQTIYTRPGAPVKFSMDISYWGKRRFRIMPVWNRKEHGC